MLGPLVGALQAAAEGSGTGPVQAAVPWLGGIEVSGMDGKGIEGKSQTVSWHDPKGSGEATFHRWSDGSVSVSFAEIRLTGAFAQCEEAVFYDVRLEYGPDDGELFLPKGNGTLVHGPHDYTPPASNHPFFVYPDQIYFVYRLKFDGAGAVSLTKERLDYPDPQRPWVLLPGGYGPTWCVDLN
jgi:hypothetical protein